MNPYKYDKMVMKELRNIGPWGKALFNTNALDFAFADADMKNKLTLEALGEQRKDFDNRADLAQGRLDLAKDVRKDAKKQDKSAFKWGLGNLALTAGNAVADWKRGKKKAEETDALTRRIRSVIGG